jgi:hypothetical protein
MRRIASAVALGPGEHRMCSVLRVVLALAGFQEILIAAV